LGLSRLAVTYFMKDELKLSPAEVAALGGITSLPWIIKPLYGFLTDGVPLFGYRRRSYLGLAGVLGCASWLALGQGITDVTSATVAIVLGSASVAVSDVVADSIVVERSRRQPSAAAAEDTAGNLQSLCWATAAVGGVLSAYFSGSLLEVVSPRVVFAITAVFPLLISAASFLIDESPVGGPADEGRSPASGDESMSLGAQLRTLQATLMDPRIYLPVLFVFCWQATPTPDSAMFYFSTNELGFQPEFLGRVRLASSLAALVGVGVYRTWLKDVSVKAVILWTSLLSVPLSLTQLLLVTHANRALGIPDQLFALTDSVVLTVLGQVTCVPARPPAMAWFGSDVHFVPSQVAFMPTLVLASSLCPPGVEGTLFASLMSIYNAAGTLSSELGAGLTSLLGVTDTAFDRLPLLVLICSLSSLLPLPFIGAIDRAGAATAVTGTPDDKPLP
jgi:folate/biopterin transporter